MSHKDFLTFEYSPLSDARAFIRILHLQPASSEFDIVVCAFEQIVPDPQSSYFVHEPIDISAQRDHVILCDGLLLPVAEETYTFLRHLRNQPDQRLRRIWSPRVCIDHGDEEERDLQAQLLPVILKNALQRISITPAYKHTALSTPDHIRIIELDPPGLVNGVLKTRVREVSLAEGPVFWYLDVRKQLTEDSWPDKTSILCNGQFLSLPTPLAQILAVVLRSKGPHAFWEPSICNNKATPLDTGLHERIRGAAKEIVGIRHPQYNYTALPEDRPHIRLLKLAPAAAPEDVLVVEIGHFPLDSSCPPFIALSYVWGSPNPPWMVCTRDGRYIVCTQNLRIALCKLRDLGIGPMLWIDAICINQKDSSEKNTQVLLMSKIYSQATEVIVDLGNTCMNDKHLVCRHFLRMLINMLSLTRSVLEAVRPERPTLQRQEHAKFGIPSFDHQAWGAWRTMRSMPWFTRSWIVQEVAASKNVTVLYNGQSFRWTDIDKANRITANEQVDLKTYGGKMNIQNQSDLQNTDKANLPMLLELVTTFRNLNATDFRDKIYAFRGLAFDQDIAPLPEYAKSVEDIFIDFASFCVRQGLMARLLLDAGRSRSRLDKLPSWVPDWSYSESWQIFSFGKKSAWISLNQLRTDTPQKLVESSGFIDSQQPHKLQTRVCFVDEVVGLSSAVSNTFMYEEVEHRPRIDREVLDLYTSAQSLAIRLVSAGLDTNLVRDSVQRTLMGGNDVRFNPLRVFYQQSGIMGDIAPSPENAASVTVFDERLRERLSERRFCITKNGRMGLVPALCDVGDDVTFVDSMQSPSLLRKSSIDDYILIGDVFLHHPQADNGEEEGNATRNQPVHGVIRNICIS
jgi:hypothetical protein